MFNQEEHTHKTYLTKIVEDYASSKRYSAVKIICKPTARNYSSVAKRIKIEGDLDGRHIEENVFAKALTDSAARNERLQIPVKFSRESFMYNVVFEEFKNLQSHLNIGEKFQFLDCVIANNDIIILQDMTEQGYKDVSNGKFLDYKHFKMMIRDIAKFHAFSFALKQQNPTKFQEVITELTDIFVPSHRARSIYQSAWEFVLPAINDYIVRGKLIENGTRLLKEALNRKHIQHGVVCHGDYHLRNVLFKYKNNEPVDMAMIDFQLSVISSPVRDLFLVFATSISEEIRTLHYFDLLDCYYNTLCTFASQLNCDVTIQYPRDTFNADFREYFPTAFAHSILTIRVLCSPVKNDEELSNIYEKPAQSGSIFVYSSPEAEDEYNCIINGLMKHYIAVNLI